MDRQYLEANKPTVSYVSSSFVSIGVKEAIIRVRVKVQNNYSFPLNVKQTNIELDDLQGKTFAVAESVKPVKIPAGKSAETELDVTVGYQNLIGILSSSFLTRTFKCTARMVTSVGVVGATMKIPLTENIEITL